MIEVPVVAEGNLSIEFARDLAPYTDFITLSGEIWAADEPVEALKAYSEAITLR